MRNKLLYIFFIASLFVVSYFLNENRTHKVASIEKEVVMSGAPADLASHSTAELKMLIKNGIKRLQKQNDDKLNLEVSYYLTEYSKRVPESSDVEVLSKDLEISSDLLYDLFDKSFLSPCWGIAEGVCKE